MIPMSPRSTLAKTEAVNPLGVVAPPPIHVTTPAFDGSLVALFQCVRDGKIELKDVPLLPICESYFAYLLASADIHLEEAAAALTALAYLLERKAWLILAADEEPPAVEEPLELPDPTVYEFELAIEALTQWQQERARKFFRTAGGSVDPYEVPFELEEIALSDLAKAFERILARAEPDPIEPLARAVKSLEEAMGNVLRALSNQPKGLDELLIRPYTRSDAVLWFLALLELIRLGRVRAWLEGEEPLFSAR